MVAPFTDALTDRTLPTMTPRIFTSESDCSWLPAVSVLSVTCATFVNALLYSATASPSSRTRTTRTATHCSRRRTTALTLDPDVIGSPRDPHGRGGAPDGEGQE